jgi:hypothetical protein
MASVDKPKKPWRNVREWVTDPLTLAAVCGVAFGNLIAG